MLNSIRLQHASVVVLTAVLCAVLPSTGWTWGSEGHHYIAQHYSQHLPAGLDGLRAYDSEVDAHVTDPDARKGSPDYPGENERHYIDIDYYQEFLAGTLPRSRAALEQIYGPALVIEYGVLPWTIEEVVTRLTTQFQARQWSAASLTIADLCHYVGDANQPLHCTVNYNGQITGNAGIHSRYESDMLSDYLGQLDTPAMTVAYTASPLDAAFDVIAAAWAGVSLILEADDVATAMAGGSPNGTTYYASLWDNTRILTQARLDTASVMTASLVNTAWVNAGRPVVGETATAAVFALYGTRPNPASRKNGVFISLALPDDTPATLELLDVTGRRVAEWRVADTGERRVNISEGRSLNLGIYFVRLTHGDRNLTARVTVVP